MLSVNLRRLKLRKNFPDRDSAFIEAARKAVVSVQWRKYCKTLSTRRGRGRLQNGLNYRSSYSGSRIYSGMSFLSYLYLLEADSMSVARSNTPPYREFRKSFQASSSRQSLPISTSSSNQAARTAPPSYRSDPPGE